MPLREPPVPALLVGAVSHEGRMVTLAVVRVHWRNEGTCIFERLSADGSHTDVVVNGTWRIVGDDDNVLDVEIDDPGDIESYRDCIDRCMAEVVKTGKAWRLEAFQPQGNTN